MVFNKMRCLQYIVFGAFVAVRIALEIAIHPAPECSITDGSAASSTYPCTCGKSSCGSGDLCNSNESQCKPDFPWTGHYSKKCSSKSSDKVTEKSFKPYEDKYGRSGFDFTHSQCQESCEENVDCKFASYGQWEKPGIKVMGMEVPGFFTGKMRCQLYSTCDLSDFEGSAELGKRTTIFDKPIYLRCAQRCFGAVTPKDCMVTAASALLTILSVVVLWSIAADNPRGGIKRKVGICCGCFAILVSVWLAFHAGSTALWDFKNFAFSALIVVYVLSALIVFCVLMGVALMDNSRGPTLVWRDEAGIWKPKLA